MRMVKSEDGRRGGGGEGGGQHQVKIEDAESRRVGEVRAGHVCRGPTSS